MSDFYPRLFEKFEESGDPVKQMGIGLSDPEILLELTVQLFGDKVMCRKLSRKEEMQLKGIPPYFKPEHYLSMNVSDWKKLKGAEKEYGKKNLLKMKYYTKNDRRPQQVGDSKYVLNFVSVLSDIYDPYSTQNEWYWDDTILIQVDTEIIDLYDRAGIKYWELIDEIKNSPKLTDNRKR